MPDVKRRPDANSVHNVHNHTCPVCDRSYSCNCAAQPDKDKLVCIDCERSGA